MKTFAIAAVAALGLVFAASQPASAGGIYIGTGSYSPYGGSYYGGGYGRHGHHGGYSGWGGYGGRGHYHYHNTSHFDYVPPRVVPHGNHYHYVPGGMQFHPQGHYDYHRGGHRNHHHHH